MFDANGNYVPCDGGENGQQKITIPEGVTTLVLTLIEYQNTADTEPTWVYMVTEGSQAPNTYVPYEEEYEPIRDRVERIEENISDMGEKVKVVDGDIPINEDGNTVVSRDVLNEYSFKTQFVMPKDVHTSTGTYDLFELKDGEKSIKIGFKKAPTTSIAEIPD